MNNVEDANTDSNLDDDRVGCLPYFILFAQVARVAVTTVRAYHHGFAVAPTGAMHGYWRVLIDLPRAIFTDHPFPPFDAIMLFTAAAAFGLFAIAWLTAAFTGDEDLGVRLLLFTLGLLFWPTSFSIIYKPILTGLPCYIYDVATTLLCLIAIIQLHREIKARQTLET